MSIVSELRYKAWGETRYPEKDDPAGDMLTSTRFTGQRQERTLGGTEGLYFYGSRWYDPALGRWAQPDSIIPNPYDLQSWDRYAYVNNNALRFTDPSGHCADEDGDGKCDPRQVVPFEEKYGVKFEGEWTKDHRAEAVKAVSDVANKMGGVYTFRIAYGASQENPLVFSWGTDNKLLTSECSGIGNGACTSSSHLINAMSVWADFSNATNTFVHELGHAFGNRLWISDQRTGNTKIRLSDITVYNDNIIRNRNSGGWAGEFGSWQQSRQNTPGEVFADMFLGWTYNAWGTTGPDRGAFMNTWMPIFMSAAIH